MALYQSLRPLIYKLTPEQAHTLTIGLLRLAGAVPPARWLLAAIFRARAAGPEVHAFGLRFANPLGMAAGYDKDGLGWRGLACLGFGHIEVGTVTPRAQPGNPLPRIFRLVEDEAVINRMGFPNQGAEAVARRLSAHQRGEGPVVGVNIGKNKDTPLEVAAGDYRWLMRRFARLADYLCINISSPNTPGLRGLQARSALEGLLGDIRAERSALEAEGIGCPPLLVKLAPDLEEQELDDALGAIVDSGMDGVVANNTSIRRPKLRSRLAGEQGGLSGRPLGQLSAQTLRRVVRRLGGRLPVIASGGVMNAQDAQARLDDGAALVQLYTGLIYCGPGLVRQVLESGLRISP